MILAQRPGVPRERYGWARLHFNFFFVTSKGGFPETNSYIVNTLIRFFRVTCQLPRVVVRSRALQSLKIARYVFFYSLVSQTIFPFTTMALFLSTLSFLFSGSFLHFQSIFIKIAYLLWTLTHLCNSLHFLSEFRHLFLYFESTPTICQPLLAITNHFATSTVLMHRLRDRNNRRRSRQAWATPSHT